MITASARARGLAKAAEYNREMQALRRLGLIVGVPMRLGRGETMESRAMAELDHMERMDEALAAVGEATHADRFRELHGQSLGFAREVLSTPVAVTEENIKLLQLKKDVSGQVMRIAARVAIEVYRGSKADVVLEMYRELQAAKAGGGVIEGTSEPNEPDEAMPDDFGQR